MTLSERSQAAVEVPAVEQGNTARDQRTGVFAAVRDGRPANEARRQPLSERFWGLDWSQHLPRPVTRRGDVVAQPGTYAQLQEFCQRVFPELQETNQQRLPARMRQYKRRHFEEDCDILVARSEGQTVALFVGAPEDWSSYYCRLIGAAPGNNMRHVIRGFAREVLFPVLAEAGVERLVGDTAPTNLAMQRMFSDLGFQPSGQNLTDRWGAMVRFTKFLDASAAEAFSRRFSPGA